jgi:hypothetical protein
MEGLERKLETLTQDLELAYKDLDMWKMLAEEMVDALKGIKENGHLTLKGSSALLTYRRMKNL